jgi:hypothetical protein
MAEITIPAIKASSVTFGLERADNVLQLLNGREVITAFAKASWAARVSLTILTEQQGRDWAGALAALSSMENYFRMTPPGYTGTIYTGSTPQVNGAGQLGTTLSIKNCTPSAVVFRPGEYFEVNGELKIVTATATANGSGVASVSFQPALRAAPTDSATVTISSPKTKFRLANPSASWQIQPGKFYIINIDAVELVQ